MAEAGGTGRENTGGGAPPTTTTSANYFCYSCNRETTDINPDFTCATCGSGFIEEIPPGSESPASPTPMLFGGAGTGGGPPVLSQLFRSISQPAGQGGQPQAVSFDLFDILSGGMQAQQQGRGQSNSTGATTSGSGPPTPSRSRPRGHFSLVIDSRPRTPGGGAGGSGGSSGNGGTSITIVGGSGGPGGAGGTPGQPGGAENPMENMLYSFLNELITGLGGDAAGANVNITGVPILGNLGDYVWGRDGLDAIVTQLMNQVEGTGPPPMPEEKVKEIPDVSISQELVDRKLQCSVCWEDFKLEEKVKQLECEHLFHPDCILPWLKLHGTCPICRRDFTDGTNPDQQTSNPNPDGSSSNPNATSTAGNTQANSNSNPGQGASANSSNSNPASPLAFLASLVNTAPFSLIGNSTNASHGHSHGGRGGGGRNPPNGGRGAESGNTGGNRDGSGGTGGSGSGGGRGTGAGGHLDLDNMEFDFD